MKRVLFVMLALVVGLTTIAQVKNPVKKSSIYQASGLSKTETLGKVDAVMNFAPGEVMTKTEATHKSAKDYEEWETMVTRYDLQSNSLLGNRIAVWEDGTAAVTATWAKDNSFSTRGTGYNYFDGEDFSDQPDARVEPFRSGWPSITPVGNGEILTSHGGPDPQGNDTWVRMYKRETKGEGEWNQIHEFVDDDYQGLGCGAWTWAKIATTGNGQYVHVIMCDNFTDAEGHTRSMVSYCRSTDGGETFSDPANPPLVNPGEDYLYDIGGDDYIIATNGDRIAILFSNMDFDLFYIYSEDNGETWSKQVVWNFRGEDHAYDWGRTDLSTEQGDTLWTPDRSASLAIDNDGVVHVVFSLYRWAPAPSSGWGYYGYFYFTFGVVYWNSNYENEQGGHNIPDFGQWSGDAQFTDEWYTTHGINYTLMDDRLALLANADGSRNLNFFTSDENHNDTLDYDNEILNNVWGAYRTAGIYTYPSISIDENNNMIIAFSSLSESRTGQLPDGKPYYLRNLMITGRNAEGEWFYDAYNLNTHTAPRRCIPSPPTARAATTTTGSASAPTVKWVWFLTIQMVTTPSHNLLTTPST